MNQCKPHQVAKNSLINAFAFAVNALIGFISVSLIVRAFGLELQGLVAFAKLFTTSGYLNLFCLGLPNLIARKVAFYNEKQEFHYSEAWVAIGLRASLFLATPIAILFLCTYNIPFLKDIFIRVTGLHIIQPDLRNLFIALILVTIPLQFIGMACQAILFGLQQFGEIRISEIGTTLLNLLSVIAIWLLKFSPIWLTITVILFELARSAYLSFFVCRRFSINKLIKIDVSSFLSDFKSELKVSFFSSLMAFLDINAVPYVAAQVLGPAGLGVYDTISKISRLMKTAFGLIASALMPYAISSEASKGKEYVVSLFRDIGYTVGVFLLPTLVCMMSLSGLILQLWLGKKYVSYAPLLVVAFLTTAASVWISLQGSLFSSRREVVASTTIVNFLENLVGLPLLFLMCKWSGVNGLFTNRLLIVWSGLAPRSLVFSRFYHFSALSSLKPFRWSIPLSVLTGLIIYLVNTHFKTAVVLLPVAGFLLLLDWYFIYKLSNLKERNVFEKVILNVMNVLAIRLKK